MAEDVHARIVIARPTAEVRKYFGDMEHQIRKNVHPGTRYSWVEADGGEARLRAEYRVLGGMKHDELVLDDSGDELVARYVAGEHEGTTVTYTFRGIADQNTEVTASVKLGEKSSGLFAGPLARRAMRQNVERHLQENKRDLEGGKYKPDAVAANLEPGLALVKRAVDRVGSVAANRREISKLLLDAACLAAVADGTVEGTERQVVAALADALGADAAQGASLERALADAAKAMLDEAVADRAHELGQKMQTFGAAHAGLVAAAMVAQVSKGVGTAELALIHQMARGAKMTDIGVATVLEDLDRALSG